MIPKQVKVHTETVIFLHGFGGCSLDFVPIFDSNISVFKPSTKIILPCAPLRYTKAEPGFKMHCWYDFKWESESMEIDNNDFKNNID